jgi:hypothetical protein
MARSYVGDFAKKIFIAKAMPVWNIKKRYGFRRHTKKIFQWCEYGSIRFSYLRK